MPQPAKPSVAIAARVSCETNARRQRLQEQLQCTVRDLIDRALLALERETDASSKKLDTAKPGAAR
jgi:hypothetical protein